MDPPSSSTNFRCIFCTNSTPSFTVLCRHHEEEHGLVIRDTANAESKLADLNDDTEDVSEDDGDDDNDVDEKKDPKIALSKVLLQRLDLLPSECPLELEEVGPVCNPAACSIFREPGEERPMKPRKGDNGDVDGEVDDDGSVDDRESVKSGVEPGQTDRSGKISLTKDKVVYLQRWLFYNLKVSILHYDRKCH